MRTLTIELDFLTHVWLKCHRTKRSFAKTFEKEDGGSVQPPCDTTNKLAHQAKALFGTSVVNAAALALVAASFRKLCLAAVVDMRFPSARPVSHDCMGWQGLEVTSTQPYQCPLSMFFFFFSSPLLQSAPPKRSDVAVSSQLARADVFLESKHDVV